MPITQDRMLDLVEAADAVHQAFRQLAKACHTALAMPPAEGQTYLSSMLYAYEANLMPKHLAQIEVERRYFARFKRYNEREKIRQRRRRAGIPPSPRASSTGLAKRPGSGQDYHASLSTEVTDQERKEYEAFMRGELKIDPQTHARPSTATTIDAEALQRLQFNGSDKDIGDLPVEDDV